MKHARTSVLLHVRDFGIGEASVRDWVSGKKIDDMMMMMMMIND